MKIRTMMILGFMVLSVYQAAAQTTPLRVLCSNGMMGSGIR